MHDPTRHHAAHQAPWVSWAAAKRRSPSRPSRRSCRAMEKNVFFGTMCAWCGAKRQADRLLLETNFLHVVPTRISPKPTGRSDYRRQYSGQRGWLRIEQRDTRTQSAVERQSIYYDSAHRRLQLPDDDKRARAGAGAWPSQPCAAACGERPGARREGRSGETHQSRSRSGDGGRCEAARDIRGQRRAHPGHFDDTRDRMEVRQDVDGFKQGTTWAILPFSRRSATATTNISKLGRAHPIRQQGRQGAAFHSRHVEARRGRGTGNYTPTTAIRSSSR